MAIPIFIKVIEDVNDIKVLLGKSTTYNRPRLKMLLLIAKGITEVNTLCAKTGAHRDSITLWKKRYAGGGMEALLSDGRGGDFKSGIDAAAKKKIEAKLSDPKAAFTSFGQAQSWIKEELGIDKKYHAINKYLKRNFGVKLKVGRKSHVKKDEAAVAFFKKPGRGTETY